MCRDGGNMMEYDWSKSDERLYEAARSAIEAFAKEHGKAEVCCFFFDCDDPQYGLIHISLDSLRNNVRTAKGMEQRAVERRKKNLKGKLTWQWAKQQLSRPVLSPFNTNGVTSSLAATGASSSQPGASSRNPTTTLMARSTKMIIWHPTLDL